MQEIALNVLDIAMNAVCAGASLIEIIVDERPSEDVLSVTISDDGRGMSYGELESVTDPFYTTRSTRRVGLGVPFIKMAAELTGGSFSISSEPGRGTAVRADFVYSSIDRMPLGDINETVQLLIQSNPQLNFVYTRRFEMEEMELDTREFRRVLDGIPLNDPEISRFIRDYLKENTCDLLRGHAS